MKRTRRLSICLASSLLLAACSGMPQLFWKSNDNKPDYARGKGGSSQADSRAPLDVPPELREQVEVPMPDKVATETARAGKGGVKMSEAEKEAVAGKAVSLDARIYEQMPAPVFSAVVDAMTALNLPVQSVDSPSGTVTTEWIREGANNASLISTVGGMFGAGPAITHYRYVVRVLRTESDKTRLEIRTLGQQYINHHWVNRPIKQKISNDLFSAVEERLGQTSKPATSDTGKKEPANNP